MNGRVVVMGSGELAPGLVGTHRAGIEAAGADSVVLIDTPYGFQENADELTERIADFFATSLSRPTEVATLRGRGATPGEIARATAAVRSGRYVFAGPGSPTHALDVWEAADMGAALSDALERGATVTFASAAALTLGSHTIPVYEIYKVGAEPEWRPGLGLLDAVGLPVPVVPHWDNAEGGTHDTSRCYIGRRRFEVLMGDRTTGALGVDEHTAASIDLGTGRIDVTGRGTLTLWTPDETLSVPAGEGIALADARDALADQPAPSARAAAAPDPDTVESAIEARDAGALLEALLGIDHPVALRDALVRVVAVAEEGLGDPEDRVRGFVELVLEVRKRVRASGDYDLADELRDGLVALGVEVRDTPDGPVWSLRSPNEA